MQNLYIYDLFKGTQWRFLKEEERKHLLVCLSYVVYLSNGDSQDEPGWRAVGVAVKVPLAVDLAGQRLVGDVSD